MHPQTFDYALAVVGNLKRNQQRILQRDWRKLKQSLLDAMVVEGDPWLASASSSLMVARMIETLKPRSFSFYQKKRNPFCCRQSVCLLVEGEEGKVDKGGKKTRPGFKLLCSVAAIQLASDVKRAAKLAGNVHFFVVMRASRKLFYEQQLQPIIGRIRRNHAQIATEGTVTLPTRIVIRYQLSIIPYYSYLFLNFISNFLNLRFLIPLRFLLSYDEFHFDTAQL